MSTLLRRWRAWRRYLAETADVFDAGHSLSPQSECRIRRETRP